MSACHVQNAYIYGYLPTFMHWLMQENNSQACVAHIDKDTSIRV
jgi:hypothetical protein